VKKNIEKNIKKIARLHKLFFAGAIFFSILLLFFFTTLIYQNIYSDKFFAGLSMTGVKLGGKTFNEAQYEITKKIDNFNSNGLLIIYQDKQIFLPASLVGDTPDIYFDIFNFNTKKGLESAFNIGRGNNFLKNSLDQITIMLARPNLGTIYYVDEDKILSILKNNLNEFEQYAKNAELIFNNNEVSVSEEAHGKIFDYKNIIHQIKKQLSHLDERPIYISLKTDYPSIYKEKASALLIPAKNALTLAPVKLSTPEENQDIKKQEWIINKEQLSNFLTVKKNVFEYDKSWFHAPELREEFFIGLNEKKIKDYFEKEIVQFTDIAPIDAKFKIENNKVTEFDTSKNGRALNQAKTFKNFEDAIKKTSTDDTPQKIIIELVIEDVASKINNDTVNGLGIKELIGVGHSNFTGSSWSRKHNISTGASSANGTLIKPGEEFSMNTTLGEVNAATGYLPEMVIKGNETIPEYGGGLCQVGTTMFRAALNTGLPISERRNHSYRVRYYEPAGTDATIYGPHPDLRFINDTENYILIQSRIEGNDIYFELWGTKDGRTATTTTPVIYNIAAPPATKLIETDTLKPGEKKCTEHAIYGADAYFDYSVVYPDGEKKEERFTSHYRPWQEVCLIGVEKKTATSTFETLDNN